MPAVTKPALYRATCACGWTEEVWVGDDTHQARTEAHRAILEIQKDHVLGLAP